ncbi:mlr7778 [Mesorhizobium japonicum MAFF 303099]|uniref:Mlr7778 protein n=5 Tax=Mesorhizobium TaxID=68287 RepID=Q984Z6_RHILO|nr:mlr7778 [Mesorhizobium japonicum MAFF 303099]
MVPGAPRPAGAVTVQLYLFVLKQFRTENRFTLFQELHWGENMQFIVIEDFTGCDRKDIYRRFRDRGRLKPEELVVHHSWIAADMSRCFLLVETDDVTLLQRWVIEWADLVEFEIIPVATSKDMVAALSGHL